MRCRALLFASLLVVSLGFAQEPIKLHVDASRIAELQVRSKVTIPVKSGRLALAYPKYIPGEHGPSGPINNMIGFRILANGKALRWWRDELDIFRLECEVPPGVDSVVVEMHFGLEPSTVASAKLGRIVWNQLLVYPADTPAAMLRFAASVTLPKSWKMATALYPKSNEGQDIAFEPTDLVTLIDSPAVAGLHFETVNLTTDLGIPHILAVAADRPEDIVLDDQTILGYRKLVQEANVLFGGRPYRRYQWLISLSDHGGQEGLEHHESSQDGMGSDAMASEGGRRWLAELNAHEYVHSWNGKFRRPAGLIGVNYQTPIRSSLLWMYEGMTQYLGTVLATRAGFWDQEYAREVLASYASSYQFQQGRTWRPLVDTATCARSLYYAPSSWQNARRDVAFYVEMIFNWIEADMIIRRVTNGAKNLDDFCKIFYAGANGTPSVKPYEIDGIVAALSATAPYDWPAWIDRRIYSVSPHLNFDGLEAAGWRLVYSDEPNAAELDLWQLYSYEGYETSLGVTLSGDMIQDVIPGLPGDQAGLTPGMKVLSVNAQAFSSDVLNRAIAQSPSTQKVDLVVERAGFMRSTSVPYNGGLKFPHLERIEGKPDLLSELFASRLSRN